MHKLRPIKDYLIPLIVFILLVGLVVYNSMVFIVGPYLHIQSEYKKSLDMLSVKENVQECEFINRHIIEEVRNVAKCMDKGLMKVFVYDDLGNKLAEIVESTIQYEQVKKSFIEYNNLVNPELTLSFYDNQIVYYVRDKHLEYLVDFNTYIVLWKVDLSYE